MKFGKDGYLYISTGDGGHQPVSADWSDLMGSIIRVTEDGRIPPRGNAFTKKAGYNTARCKFMGRPLPRRKGAICAEIWAKGLRNPFRFAMDPNAEETRFFVGDVGGGKWEEISEGGTNFRGADYGWPVREGPCSRFGGTTACELLPQYQDPVYWYRHSDTYKGGGAIVGGAFVPNGIWPNEYDGKFIFPDYVFDELYVLHEQTPCRVGCSEHIPAYSNATFHGWDRITGVVFGPHRDTQALYYLTRTRKAEHGIRRIFYTGNEQNRPPVALLTANATYVEVGDVVSFDASASFDPDGDMIRYQFTVNGIRFKWSRDPILTYEFENNGRQNIRLRVRDSNRLRALDHVKVFVGDLPKVEVTSPPLGAQFSVGEVLTLSANASTYSGEELPDSALSWEVKKHHNTHFHPFFSRVGNHVTLPKAPIPEDLVASTNSYLEVILRVTDPDTELVREVRRNVMPRLISLQIDSVPSGLTLRVFDEEIVTPEIVYCWENQPLHVIAHENPGYAFESWSNGADADQIIVVSSDGVLKYSATYIADE